MLTILAKLLKTLNSEQSPGQIAAAVSLAAIVGLTPLLSLHNLLVVFVVLLFRVNLTVFLVMWPLFTVLGILISPLAESLGLYILQQESLLPTWENFYNTLLGRWSNFYYAGLMGSLVISLLVAPVIYPLAKIAIVNYRSRWLKKFEQYHLVKLLKASKFWQLYEKIAD